MRICLATDFYYPWIGGPSAVIRNLAHGLADRGHSVAILAPSPTGPPSQENEDGIEIRRVRTLPLPFGYKLRTAVWPRSEVAEFFDDFDPDVVHFHHPFPISATAVLQARRRGIPLVATNHTIPECSLWGIRNLGPFYKGAKIVFERWLAYLLGKANYVATPTATAALAISRFALKQEVTPISNGVDTRRFRPGEKNGELAQKLQLGPEPVVLYTGRLDAEKQMDVWLRAAAKALEDGADGQLVIGGLGTDREHLEALSYQLGITDRVHFIGYVSDAQLPDLYRLADVYFISSPVELQSVTTLEAMATGLPIVAANAGALPELVKNGENGFLFEAGNWPSAVDGLRTLLSDRHQRQSIGERSREIAVRHELTESIEQYEHLLTKAVDGKREGVRIGRASVAEN